MAVPLSVRSESLPDALEREMLHLPQLDIPIIHRFGPGIYIREMLMPAGSTVVGHEHKTDHSLLLLSGHLLLRNPDGLELDLVAPAFLVGHPGRKVLYALQDSVVQNIHATNETDLDKLEDALIVKSQAHIDYTNALALESSAAVSA